MEVPADDNQAAAAQEAPSSTETPIIEEEVPVSLQEKVALMKGDVQGSEIGNYLRKRITEEQFDAFCIDCQNNRSSHCNVTFGTFICETCAKEHERIYSQF